MNKNKSKVWFLLTYWILNTCPCVHAVQVILICENIFHNKIDKSYLGTKKLGQHGLLGQQLKINDLILFSTWTHLNTTMDK